MEGVIYVVVSYCGNGGKVQWGFGVDVQTL